ncbi:MAG: hypothetical protein JWM78_2617 [Verrucomicrobiaceae bacterium]|nr:hypothetical protein [Verrucomicrobiaceae bacterium]
MTSRADNTHSDQERSDHERRSNTGKLTRARTDQAKEKVRADVIRAGQELFAAEDFEKVSLRKIAAAANYSPGTVYQYFSDRDALFIAIRDLELIKLNDALHVIADKVADPEQRLWKMIEYSMKFWKKNFGRYGESFLSGPPLKKINATTTQSNSSHMDQSPASATLHQLFDNSMKDFFDTLPRHPLPVTHATDAMIAAIDGVMIIPDTSPHRRWTEKKILSRIVFDALVHHWRALTNERN